MNAYAHQFNVGVNRTLTRDIAVTADVSIDATATPIATRSISNLPDQTTRAEAVSAVRARQLLAVDRRQHLQALLLKVEKRMSNRYQFLVSYTLSKAKDDAGRPTSWAIATATSQDRAVRRRRSPPSAGHQRHRAAAARRAALGDRRLPVEPAVRADERARPQRRRLRRRSAGRRDAGHRVPRPESRRVNAFRRGAQPHGGDDGRLPRLRERRPAAVEVLPHRRRPRRSSSRSCSTSSTARTSRAEHQHRRAATTRPGGRCSARRTTLLPNINAPSRQAEFAVRFQF